MRVGEWVPDLLPNTKTTSRLYAGEEGIWSGLSNHGSAKLEKIEEELGLGVREG